MLVAPAHLLGGPGRPGRGQPVLVVMVGQRDPLPGLPHRRKWKDYLKQLGDPRNKVKNGEASFSSGGNSLKARQCARVGGTLC